MTTRPAPPSSVLLVVEDSDEDFDTVCEAIRKAGLVLEVRRAFTGDACLALLRGEGAMPALRPALVLMDLNTPGTDGRSALAQLKSDPTLQALVVVVLSTSGSDHDVASCYRAGANAYHMKRVRYPEHVDLLVDVLTYWLRHVRVPSIATMVAP